MEEAQGNDGGSDVKLQCLLDAHPSTSISLSNENSPDSIH